MIKFSKITKRILSLFLVAILNTTSYAAVGGNDGSAFVTKAEFDALVNTFNEQMDNYSDNIITKIDGAIANYIAAQSASNTFKRSIALPLSVNKGILSVGKNAKLDYSYGIPTFYGWSFRTDFRTGNYGSDAFVFKCNQKGVTSDEYKVDKTVITNIRESNTKYQSTAMWSGYYEDGYDYVSIGGYNNENAYNSFASVETNGGWAAERMSVFKNTKYLGENKDVVAFRNVDSSGNERNNGLMIGLCPVSIDHDWGENTSPYVSVIEPYDYDMFSNMDRDLNWGYDGSYMTKFADYTFNKTNYSQGKKPINNIDLFQKALGTTNYIADTSYRSSSAQNSNIRYTGNFDVRNFITKASTGSATAYVPMVGFETTFLTNWKQIYDGNTSNIADFEKTKHGSETGASSRAILQDKNNTSYLGLTAGFPLIKLNKDERLTYNLKFADISKNYVVWFSTRPYNLDTHPDTDDNCIEVTGLNKAQGTDKGYMVVSGEGTFTTPIISEDCYLYLKWGINNATKANIAGGRLMPEKEGTITVDN